MSLNSQELGGKFSACALGLLRLKISEPKAGMAIALLPSCRRSAGSAREPPSWGRSRRSLHCVGLRIDSYFSTALNVHVRLSKQGHDAYATIGRDEQLSLEPLFERRCSWLRMSGLDMNEEAIVLRPRH